jgi:hypothetical protein
MTLHSKSGFRRHNLEKKLSPWREKLISHPLYDFINDENSLIIFMENHVFSVWDFQSLLKSLQVKLTCVETPWVPTNDTIARRLINEIVLDEESGIHPQGGYCSHFELYREAMIEAGANIAIIDKLIHEIEKGTDIHSLLKKILPKNVFNFVTHTFKNIDDNNLINLLSMFTYGREDIIPSMFNKLIKRFAEDKPIRWSKLNFYFNEHIQCDVERHGPMAKKILENFCGDDELKWSSAESSAINALKQRKLMWDNILESVN